MLKTAIRMLIGFAVLLVCVSIALSWRTRRLNEEAKKEENLTFIINDQGQLLIENPTEREYSFDEANIDLKAEENGVLKPVENIKYEQNFITFYVPPTLSTEIDLNTFWNTSLLDTYQFETTYYDNVWNYFTKTVYYSRESREEN